MKIFSSTDIDYYIIQTLIIDIIIVLIISLFYVGIYRFINKIKKLNNSDYVNLSTGITSISLIVTAINNSDLIEQLLNETIVIFFLTIFFFLIIKLSNMFFEKIFTKDKSIHQDNVYYILYINSVIIAKSILIKSLIIWVDIISYIGIIYILLILIWSEIVCFIADKIYLNQDNKSQIDFLLLENKSVSKISLIGFRIGLAFALTGTNIFVPYDIIDVNDTLMNWVIWSILICIIYLVIIKILTFILEKYFDQNISIGKSIFKSSIYIVIGLLISNLIW